jgi:hypothetical protein
MLSAMKSLRMGASLRSIDLAATARRDSRQPVTIRGVGGCSSKIESHSWTAMQAETHAVKTPDEREPPTWDARGCRRH